MSLQSIYFDILILSYYSVVLSDYTDVRSTNCYYAIYGWTCDSTLSNHDKLRGYLISSLSLFLAILELAASIGSIVLSNKAYGEWCNPCDCSDCCTCIGCCECDTAPLNIKQVNNLFTNILYSANLFYFPLPM